jgi:hypothetical protein
MMANGVICRRCNTGILPVLVDQASLPGSGNRRLGSLRDRSS